jgi:hypothetical protein
MSTSDEFGTHTKHGGRECTLRSKKIVSRRWRKNDIKFWVFNVAYRLYIIDIDVDVDIYRYTPSVL